MAKKTISNNAAASKIDSVHIRMYCMGTGDCFILKFCSGESTAFTMMVDCGSCQGGPQEFAPYIDNLATYVKGELDLLVVTHEHNDHVNGFAKCEKVFADPSFHIKEAWFAWTEDPADPDGRAAELQKKRSKMRLAFEKAFKNLRDRNDAPVETDSQDFYASLAASSRKNFLGGLQTLAEINLPEELAAADSSGASSKPLVGMTKIKQILAGKGARIKYLSPGDTQVFAGLAGFKFHVLGPPDEKSSIFKDGKEGRDVYRKKLNFFGNSLSMDSFVALGDKNKTSDSIPFSEEYLIADKTKPSLLEKISSTVVSEKAVESVGEVELLYNQNDNAWRKIDDEWLNSAGSLALRLNSHINNTSLVLAIECVDTQQKKVILLPGDAEFGSWESWHLISKWKNFNNTGRHFVEDLLRRTVFYKVGHHLSYNGTALEKGIMMMDSAELAAMATLDRSRISSKWKSTMPNTHLMKELLRRCQGKLFIMDEFEIANGPSARLNPATLGKEVYQEGELVNGKPIFKQYNLRL